MLENQARPAPLTPQKEKGGDDDLDADANVANDPLHERGHDAQGRAPAGADSKLELRAGRGRARA